MRSAWLVPAVAPGAVGTEFPVTWTQVWACGTIPPPRGARTIARPTGVVVVCPAPVGEDDGGADDVWDPAGALVVCRQLRRGAGDARGAEDGAAAASGPGRDSPSEPCPVPRSMPRIGCGCVSMLTLPRHVPRCGPSPPFDSSRGSAPGSNGRRPPAGRRPGRCALHLGRPWGGRGCEGCSWRAPRRQVRRLRWALPRRTPPPRGPAATTAELPPGARWRGRRPTAASGRADPPTTSRGLLRSITPTLPSPPAATPT